MKKLIVMMAVTLLATFISCGNAEAEPRSVNDSEILQTQDEEDAIRRDAEMYAEAEGVSVNEAIRRFELRNDVGPLQAAIVENEEAYAGSWIQHQPEYKFVFAFTENGEKIINKYVEEGSPLAEKIKLLTFEFSYRELQEIREEVKAFTENLGIYSSSSIDMKNNCINFHFIDKAAADDAIRQSRLEIPDCVNILQFEGLEIPDGVTDDESEFSSQDYKDELIWSQWWAVSVNGSDIIDGRIISLYLRYDGTVLGTSGCNIYSGHYSVKGKFIRFSAGTSTNVGCDEEILRQEDTYIDCLRNADSYSVDGNNMTIYDNSGQTLLVFERRPEYPLNPDDLIGTSWRLYSVDGEQVREEETGTLVFDEDGVSLHGLDSVTKYEYSYEARGDDIVFTSIKGERIRKPSGEFAHGRPSAISYISPIISYRLINGQLEIYTEGKMTLVFELLESSGDDE
jgi:heat shock protein HslJ